ncbi:MAG TPA: MFS transporter [Devosia sp.]|jgi:predicted MFS family arabinose efflux permease|uniref:MFS transporter n=1 Tax=Devosia sp. TaxID=1871048 RepID=UPI002F94915A
MTAATDIGERRGLLTIVTLASVSSQLVAGLIWSGLPHYAAVVTGQYALYGLLFVISSVAGVIAPMVGGYIPTRISSVSIAICASLITASSYMVVANLDFTGGTLAIAIVLLVGSLAGALSAPAFGDLLGRIQKQAYDGDLEAGSGHYQTFVMMAKMLGFALGPIAFGYLGITLLYIIAFGFVVEAALLYSMRYYDKPEAEPSRGTGAFLSWPLLRRTRVELAVAFLNGVMSFPLISLALIVLGARLDADTVTVSAFWLATGATSVAINALVARGAIRKAGRRLSLVVATLMVFAAICAVAFAPNAIFLIIGFCMFTIGNPIIGAVSRNFFFHAAPDSERRVFFGVVQTVMALGVSAGVAGITLIDQGLKSSGSIPMLVAFAALLLMRIVLMSRAVRRFETTESIAKG